MTASVPMPVHRSFVVLIAVAMALGTLVPLLAPPRTDAVSTDIVISEFRTRGPAGAADEFVELHNRSGLTVDVGGWLVRRSNATPGFSATQLTIPAGTSIAPGCFYLVTNSAGYSGSVAHDATYGTGIVDDGGIGVVTAGSETADAVGMNSGTFFREGTTLAPLAGLADQSYERLPGGTTGHDDTDDNAADFALLAPSNPQNSSSPCLPVSGTTSPSGAGAASPASVPVGGTTLLTVTVTPGTNPPSTGLTVAGDLTPIGGSATQEFSDDGTNGDVTAGDNIFSFSATVGAVPPGTKSLPVTIADAEARSGSAQIAVTVEGAPTEIWEIQGAGHVSPLAGTTVFGVEGVVTAVSGSGFWMTDPTPDGDPLTSDGLLVFRGGGAKPAVGAMVQVNGPVVEFRPGGSGGFENLTLTEITTPNTFAVTSTGNALPVTVIGEDGRMPPSEVIDDDTAGGDGTIDGPGAVTTYDPANDGIDFYESLEGMYVQVNDAVAVGPRTSFGEIVIVGDGGEHAGPFTARGGLIIGPGAFNPERIHLDDVLNPTPMVNVGDEFTTAVTGVMDYSFGNFKLLPTTALVGVDNGLIREAADATGARELSVATYNVENLTVGNPQAKFDELADQIIHNLQAPDLIAIEEMQDDSGGTNNGVVTAQAGWDKLIATIGNRGGPVYGFRSIDPVNNADGGAPGSNIRVGFLFRTDRGLEFVDRPGGTAMTDTGVVATQNGKGAQLTVSPGRVLPDPAGPLATAFIDTRKSLAGEFRWRGETLFVVANHFSSKGDDHPLFGRFQPPVRFTEFQSGTPEDGWRHAQAQVINDFVDEILAVDDAHVIVLGDINDFHFSETVGVLTGELVAGSGGPDPDGSGPALASGDAPVLATLFDGLAADERYSYVFEGNSQVLDQILVSTSLLVLDPRYDVVHVNAEFASQASDHDPSVMRVSFQPRRGR